MADNPGAGRSAGEPNPQRIDAKNRRLGWLLVGLLVLVNIVGVAIRLPQWMETAFGEQSYAIIHHDLQVDIPWPTSTVRIQDTLTLTLREGFDGNIIQLRLGHPLHVERALLRVGSVSGAEQAADGDEIAFSRSLGSLNLMLPAGTGWRDLAAPDGTFRVQLVYTLAASDRTNGPLTGQGLFLLYDDMWMANTTELASQHTGALRVTHPVDLPVAASGEWAGQTAAEGPEPAATGVQQADTVTSVWVWTRPLAGGVTLVASPEYTVIADDERDPTVLCYVLPAETETAAEVARFARECIDYYTGILGYPPPLPYQIVTAPRESAAAQGTFGLTVFRDTAWGWGGSGVPAPWRYRSIIAHEIAHHWWGHVCQVYHARGGPGLAEGMAEYWSVRALADLGDQPAATRYAEDRQLRWSREARDRSDSTPLSRLWVTSGIFGTQHIAYLKGGMAMLALEWFVGQSAFDQACRQMVAACDFGLGTLDELRWQVEAAAPDRAGMDEFWTRWFDQTGLPEVTRLTASAVAADGRIDTTADDTNEADFAWLLRIELEQGDGRPFPMQLPAEVRFEDGAVQQLWIELAPQRVTVLEVLLASQAEPWQLRLDPLRLGLYGSVPALVTRVEVRAGE